MPGQIQLSAVFDAAGMHYTPEHIQGGKWAPGGPVGIVIHHQVGLDEIGSDGALEFVKRGPIAPYYNVWHNYGDGARHIISEDEANHAGEGDPEHLVRIVDGVRVDERPDLPRHVGADVGRVGNAWLYGICLEGPDSEGEHTPQQYQAAVASAAAICDHYGWDPHVVVMGHKEWATAPKGRKSDPLFDMDRFRQDVEDTMTLSAQDRATLDYMAAALGHLFALGWNPKDPENTAKRWEYPHRMRVAMAARAKVDGSNGDAIAAAYALLADVADGQNGVTRPEFDALATEYTNHRHGPPL